LRSHKQSADGISIRSAAEIDLSVVKTLYGQLTPDLSNVDRDFPAIVRDPNSICLLVEVRNQPIGMVICYVRTSLSSGTKMIIDDIVIDRNCRGQGYGRSVIKHCVGLAKARSLDCIELACSLSKPELHRFYEGVGFKHRMRFYSLFLEDE
jgi:ribosomal protein S18 acetylase RimI-like enzyme